MKGKIRFFIWIAIILLLLIIYDFVIKNLASAQSISAADYLERYYVMNLYGWNNIYLLTLFHIFFGVLALLIFLKNKKYFKRTALIQTMIVIDLILLFLNLFSLM